MPWEIGDVLTLSGKISYYKMVEKNYVEKFIQWFNQKHNVNLMRMIRDELSYGARRVPAEVTPAQSEEIPFAEPDDGAAPF